MSVGYLYYPRGEGAIYGEVNSGEKVRIQITRFFTAEKPDITAKEILI